MTPQEICGKAADQIATLGWGRGVTSQQDGSVCMQYALFVASDGVTAAYLRALDHLYASLSLSECDDIRDVPKWEDVPGRTKEHVIAALRAAASQPSCYAGFMHG